MKFVRSTLLAIAPLAAAMLAQGRNADLSGWIGKSALVESRTAMPMADGYIRGEVSAPAGATGLSIAFLMAPAS